MVSVEFASIIISIMMMYLFLYNNKTRWIRIAGCFGIMITSIGLGVIADTIPLFILMTVNLLIALLKVIEETGEIIKVIK